MIRKTLLALMVSGIGSVACAAHDLTTINNTDFSSTAYINHRSCSSSIPGGDGVTAPHSTKTIAGFLVGLACLGNSSSCSADIFLDNDCKGTPIATVILDTNSGVKSIQMLSSEYQITSSDPFTFTLAKI